jgi:hypothetical protein
MKRILAMLLAVTVLVSFSACQTKDTAKDTAATPKTSQDTTPAAEGQTTESAKVTKEAEKPVTITFCNFNSSGVRKKR